MNEFNNTSPFCKICNRPYSYVGDVPVGGFHVGSEPYCTCKSTVPMLGGFEFPKKAFKFCPHCGEKL